MYEYRGYTIIISKSTAAVLAYKDGKLIYTAATDSDIEDIIDSAMSQTLQ